MSFKDQLTAILIAAIWGFNVVVIKIGLQDIPPILLGALRFFFVVFPLIFFIKKPDVPFKNLFAFGCFEWYLKFILLFSALAMGLACGLGALALQTQALFTMMLSALFFRTRIKNNAILGIIIAFLGISYLGCGMKCSVDLTNFMLILASALCWSIGNLLYKKMGDADMLSVIVWSSAIPLVPYFATSIYFEGVTPLLSLHKILTWKSCFSIFYTSIISTHIGTTLWGHLIRKYDPSIIAPYSLLIPVFSIAIAWSLIGEILDKETVFASILIFIGLGINQGVIKINLFKMLLPKRYGRPL